VNYDYTSTITTGSLDTYLTASAGYIIAGTVTNAPTASGFLSVHRWGSSGQFVLQSYVDLTVAGKIYHRVYSGAWGAWYQPTPADVSVTTAKIADDAVTLAKQASGAANRLQGFDASGNPSEITVSGATLSAGALTVPSPQLQKQVYTSGSGNWTSPANITSATVFKVTVTGAGAGGGYGNLVGTGGGAGATAIKYVTGLAASTGYAYAVGAAGAGGTSGAQTGTTGGSSTFNDGTTTYTGAGGVGGTPSGGPGGLGGTATNGDINIFGGDGDGSNNSQIPGGSGGASFWGSGGTGGNAVAGTAGRAYGSGGAAGTNSNNGGAGAGGIVTIEWVA